MRKQCFWCRLTFPFVTRDHVVPLGAGGPDHSDNIVPACDHCNNERGRIVGFWCLLKKLVLRIQDSEVRGQRFKRATFHMRRNLKNRLEEILNLQRKWVDIERSRLGSSPSADLVLVLPRFSY